MSRLARFTAAVLAVALLPTAAASAQESNLATQAEANPLAPTGWSFTPSLTYSGAWDDNVLIRGKGDEAPADFLNVINPHGTLDYNSARGQLSGAYDGAFLLYRELQSLNSYDQHGWFYARRLLSRHVALFVRNTVASVPTTEYSQLVAIPFVRTGSRLDALRGGVEIAFTKRTSIAAGYDFEWVDFDNTTPGAEGLQGGHSNGASASLRHALSARLVLIADYSLQHGHVATIDETFDVQNGSLGVEYKMSDLTRFYAAAGVSHLVATETATSRTGPALRLGLTRHFRTADLDLGYSRSFVPSYGFGGTMQNEEANARVRVPLARRVYSSAGVSWRRNDPLIDIEPPLRSTWIEVSLGYAMSPWAHIEAFYGGSQQTIDRPGGELDRNRFGFQVITSKPMRIH
jgi:hypothetical protein